MMINFLTLSPTSPFFTKVLRRSLFPALGNVLALASSLLLVQPAQAIYYMEADAYQQASKALTLELKDKQDLYRLCSFGVGLTGAYHEKVFQYRGQIGYSTTAETLEANYKKVLKEAEASFKESELEFLRNRALASSLIVFNNQATYVPYWMGNDGGNVIIKGTFKEPLKLNEQASGRFIYQGHVNGHEINLVSQKNRGESFTTLEAIVLGAVKSSDKDDCTLMLGD